MMDLDATVSLIALTLGVGWASGINLYAATLALGVAGLTGYADLPAGIEILENPLVIAAAGLMYCIEFLADKVPGVDTGWDALQTFVRIPAGAMLASGITGDQSLALELITGLAGGSLAATTHAAKAGSRALINTSPEPFSNWAASITEDVGVFGGVWLMLNHPWWFVGSLLLFIALIVWLLPKLWRAIKFIVRKVAALFGAAPPEPLESTLKNEGSLLPKR
ncbi:MAG: DUF4126 domain-containing protein [Pseudomonadales bacterium]|nr:DUF4126 domain-containing protein [Pseudomonadales bacterium]